MNNATINNAEYAYLRSVLGEGRFELISTYERGIINAGQYCESYKRIADKFAETGLDFGAEKFNELYEIISKSRFESKWRADGAVLKIAEIWNYIGVCEDRLNFYEILDGINAGVSV